jgi:hypothetical protein
MRKILIIPANEHSYITGAQHVAGQLPKEYTPVHDTRIIWLQNDAGASMWPVTKKIVKGVRDVWK